MSLASVIFYQNGAILNLEKIVERNLLFVV